MLTLYYSRIDSPVGSLLLAMSDRGLAILAFGHELPDRLGGEKIDWQESNEACATVRQQLEEYFAGHPARLGAYELDKLLQGERHKPGGRKRQAAQL